MGSSDVFLEPLCLLVPHAIPTNQLMAEWAASGGWNTLGTQGFNASSPAENSDMALFPREVPATFSQRNTPVEEGDRQEADKLHDAYFCVHRVEGHPAEVFARMALSARVIFLSEIEDAPVTIGVALLEDIDRALADLALCLCGDGVGYVAQWQTRGSACKPMFRWIRGHQIFAALSQGLIFSFQSMGRAIRAGKSEDMRQWADLSISLLRGSGAAFLLTGDFSPEEYMNVVRPSMMPPHCDIGLSGLMSVDHRYLVQTIRDLKPALIALHEQDPNRHDRLQQEMSLVYDRHIHVCERFVGARPSLLTQRHAKKSGPALIEQFKTLRMKPFHAPSHAVRLKPLATSHDSQVAPCSFAGAGSHREQEEFESHHEDL